MRYTENESKEGEITITEIEIVWEDSYNWGILLKRIRKLQ